MPQPDLAELLEIAASSQARSLHQLAAAAVRSIPGCSAADVLRWLDGEDGPDLVSSTHPDLARLTDVQLRLEQGPLFEALTGPEPVICPDMLDERRWPEYATAALSIGVRCTLTLAYHADQGALCMTLAATRPAALDPRQAEPAELLAAIGGAVLGAVSQYDDALRVASQLHDAAESRAVVDQAKGVLMYALGCTADEALDRIRRVSQQGNQRAVDVARDILATAGRPAGAQRAGAAGAAATRAASGIGGRTPRSGDAGR